MSAEQFVATIILSTVIGTISSLCVVWFVGGLIEHFKTKIPLRCCLGIHKPDTSNITRYRILTMCTCKRCKKELQQDSQGNWF